jgi:hypothetical protein
MNKFESILEQAKIDAAAMERRSEQAKLQRLENLKSEMMHIDKIWQTRGGIRSDAVDMAILAEKIKAFGPSTLAYRYGFNPNSVASLVNNKQKTLTIPMVQFFLGLFGPEILKE